MKEVTVFFDGGIRQGIMALGFVAYDPSGKEIFCGNRLCGKILSSSNIAEYRALIAALQRSLKEKVDIIHIVGDSQLIIRQVLGFYKANKPALIKHRDFVLELLTHFEDFTIKWVPRRENKRADALVNEVFERRKPKCARKRPKR
jgi:ribonuclease HI